MLHLCRVIAVLLVAAAAGLAHTVDTVALRASLSPASEVPPVSGVTASGGATVLVHLTRAAGVITSGVVEFDVDYNFAGPAEFIGLRIQSGPAGSSGDIVIPTNLSATSLVRHTGGIGGIRRQVVVADPRALLERLLAQPEQLYVNLLTTANPNGVMRGQLARADVLVLRAHMTPVNEVPAILNVDASGAANVIALAVRDASGQIVSGVVRFDANYRFNTADGTFSGFHIHNGPAGINAGVQIQPAPGVSAAEGILASGSGNITRTSADITAGAALDALRGLFVNPQGYYINLHTAPTNTGGVIRSQLQNTGSVTLRMELSPGNVSPPVTGVHGESPATITTYVTRDQSGQVTSGTVIFDVNYELPAGSEITGLNIHSGAAGANGDVVINSGQAREITTGAGNIFRIVNVDRTNPAALAALNGLLANPERYYVNLQTAANPAGLMRSQMAAPAAGPPAINNNGVVNAVNDGSAAPASPGSIITLYGTNFMRTLPAGLGLDYAALPVTLNGTEVRIGSRQASFVYADQGQINVQVPYETPEGAQTVFVVRSGEFSQPYSLNVTRFSPGLFFGATGGVIVKNSDFSVITPDNPASVGDVLLIFCTGLGGVTPPVGSGVLAPLGPISLTTTAPTVTIGQQDVPVLASALTPTFAGLYQIAVRVPDLGAGPYPVIVTTGGQRSNFVRIVIGRRN